MGGQIKTSYIPIHVVETSKYITAVIQNKATHGQRRTSIMSLCGHACRIDTNAGECCLCLYKKLYYKMEMGGAGLSSGKLMLGRGPWGSLCSICVIGANDVNIVAS